MGMTIDKSIALLEDYLEWQKQHGMDGTGIDEATRNLIDAARKYQIMQADYETRLRADMVAMLTEIQLEIEELKSYESADGQDLAMLADIGILFQQKINALKGDTAAG